jgi:hypothetical protein
MQPNAVPPPPPSLSPSELAKSELRDNFEFAVYIMVAAWAFLWVMKLSASGEYTIKRKLTVHEAETLTRKFNEAKKLE